MITAVMHRENPTAKESRESSPVNTKNFNNGGTMMYIKLGMTEKELKLSIMKRPSHLLSDTVSV
eukprot:CAMPEP_0184432268 /NCGR_PEP_ID=MMETSP0738-20130409/341179_1 /TAXON_ID=385413 /ORGANISM="Thalassiosira miniscula, Strain CCMP1093" /LENGTH=63 /DNA_ID=CAMNT_0026797551 /DNA_START=180 /DNA_END=371 /DNA_ORIENTATION=-